MSKVKKLLNPLDEMISFIKKVTKGKNIKLYLNYSSDSRNIDILCRIDKYKYIGFNLIDLKKRSVDKNTHEERFNLLKDTEHYLNEDIRIVHIFEDEWINKKKLVKDKIKTLLNLNTKKIYARDCIVREVKPSDKNEFLNKNHIQGKDSSNIKLGLYTSTKYYEEETLVAVMTFCKPRKALGQGQNNKNKFDYELSRYAGLLGCNVIGGFSKLLSYFEKNYEWNKIITYADRRWSDGNLYLKNNFKMLRTSEPSYWYFRKGTIIREYRYAYRKTALKEKFPQVYSDDKTEKAIMKEAGYYHIYDCGTFVFEYYNKFNNYSPND